MRKKQDRMVYDLNPSNGSREQVSFKLDGYGATSGWTFPPDATGDPEKMAGLIDFAVRRHFGLPVAEEKGIAQSDVVDTTGVVVEEPKALKVVDSALVPVYQMADGRHGINAREMHKFLEAKWKFSEWVRERISKYGFIEGEDFFRFSGKSTGGRPTTEYWLFMDMAKEIAMVENNEKGRMVRRHFIEIEKRYRADVATKTEVEKLRAQPKVELSEANSRVVVSTHIICQVLGMKDEDAMMRLADAINRDVEFKRENISRSCYKCSLNYYKPEYLLTREAFEALIEDPMFSLFAEGIAAIRRGLGMAEEARRDDLAALAAKEQPAALPEPPEPEVLPRTISSKYPDKRHWTPEEAAAELGLAGYRVLYEVLKKAGFVRKTSRGLVPTEEHRKFIRGWAFKTKNGNTTRRVIITPWGMDYLESIM